MRPRSLLRGAAVLAVLVTAMATLAATSSAAAGKTGRYLVVARSVADYRALRVKAERDGARVVLDLPELKTVVVSASASVRDRLAANPQAMGVAADPVGRIGLPEAPAPTHQAPGRHRGKRLTLQAPAAARAAAGIDPDPAFDYRGLLWDYRHIGLPQGWRTTAGSPSVTVGVADTGLDFTHVELRSKVTAVYDLTQLQNPSVCKADTGISDEDLAARFGGPAEGDWNGHGSWIGGNIAAALNRTGTNGIAPRVGLVSLKIAQWCESTTASTIINAFVLAARLGIDVVNVSFGGFLDRSTAEGDLIYRLYVDAVRYARSRGTVVVAAAGNDHVRVGAGGRVLSHGVLTIPGTSSIDPFGRYEVPGGVPGVVNVAATGRVVNAPSASCRPGTAGNPDNFDATCKPRSDPHQASGIERSDQLAYYSNYGPRIDVAAPGGARKFNLPAADRGGTPGFPVTLADLTNAWETFSTTSNWVVDDPRAIRCFTFGAGSGFLAGQCYSTIGGTSMAAPHVAAALALTASAHPALRHRPGALIGRLKAQANRDIHNTTTALSATDTSPGDLTGVPCPTRYCHLGGRRIPDQEAYGAGLVNVTRP